MKLVSIGELLKNARLEKGLSLQDVEEATKIRSKYLQAIENDCYDALPGEIYAKGFIRSYAKFLNLNQKEELEPFIAERFNNSLPDELIAEESINLNKQNDKVSNKQGVRINKKKAFRLLLVLLSIVALSVVAVYLIKHNIANDIDSEPTNVGTTANVIQAHTFQVQNTDETDNDAENIVAKEKLILKIDIVNAKKNSVDKCWLSVSADGVLLWEETLSEGSSREIIAEKEISVKAGNAGVVNVTFNQQNLGIMGNISQVITKTYSLENTD